MDENGYGLYRPYSYNVAYRSQRLCLTSLAGSRQPNTRYNHLHLLPPLPLHCPGGGHFLRQLPSNASVCKFRVQLPLGFALASLETHPSLYLDLGDFSGNTPLVVPWHPKRRNAKVEEVLTPMSSSVLGLHLSKACGEERSNKSVRTVSFEFGQSRNKAGSKGERGRVEQRR